MKRGHLLLIIIVLIICIIGIAFSLVNMKNPSTTINPTDNNVDSVVRLVIDRNEFFTLENLTNKFFKYYSSMYENINQTNLIKTYSLLDKKYISFKGVNSENIKEVLPRAKDSAVIVNNIYVSKQRSDISVYIVEGLLREEVSKTISNFKIMIQLDYKNETFSVFLKDYIDAKHKDINLGKTFKMDTINNIEPNRYNIFQNLNVSDADYAVKLVERYNEEMLYNTELAYIHLNAEYKTAKFEDSIQAFKEYIKSNQENILSATVQSYSVTQRDDYTQYICIDNNGKYYIFREQYIMGYEVILDSYTLDLPEFLEEYNKAKNMKKVGYNITKCLNAINNDDYAYVYNKLDYNFKALNYVTLEKFEQEIKTKLFNVNKIKGVSSLNEGETYIYKLNIMDANDETKEQKMTVIMKLKEGTDFVMSFSFE